MRLNELHKNAISLVKIDCCKHFLSVRMYFLRRKRLFPHSKTEDKLQGQTKNRINVNRSTLITNL